MCEEVGRATESPDNLAPKLGANQTVPAPPSPRLKSFRSIARLLLGLFLVHVWLLSGTPTAGQDVHVTPRQVPKIRGEGTGPSLDTHTKPFRADVDVVLVPVTVTDYRNRVVQGLEAENFVLFDDKAHQEIRYFYAEDAPISLGVIFDGSGSMDDKIDRCRQAVMEFFKTANPEDEFFITTFSDHPRLLADFTQSVDEIQNQLLLTVAKGRTSLLDAIYLALTKMSGARYQRKALLILSDGGDNSSRYTEREIKNLVKEFDVRIYAIGIFDGLNRTSEESYGPSLLREITELTGGRTFAVDDPNLMPDTAAKISLELRNQYVLGYRPTNIDRNGKWRKIKVKLLPPEGLPRLEVHAKQGYYAPSP